MDLERHWELPPAPLKLRTAPSAVNQMRRFSPAAWGRSQTFSRRATRHLEERKREPGGIGVKAERPHTSEELRFVKPGVAQKLKELAKGFNVSLKIRPNHSAHGLEHGERGLVLELVGSHCSDPTHYDPSCPMCHCVRAALLVFAEIGVKNIAQGSGHSMIYRIDSDATFPHFPRFQRRPRATVSIRASRQIEPDTRGDSPEIKALNEITQRLGELGIYDRSCH
jgi:hypothetical protein